MKWVVGEAEAGQRLDRVLAELSGAPRNQVQRWIEAECVRVDGDTPRASAKLAEGAVLEAEPPEPVAAAVEPEPISLVVLHEDEHLIVIDKPAGLVVHPGPGHSGGTLVNALLHHCGDLAGIGGVLRPGIVHRLDRGTSGVMVAAKNDAAHLGLAEQFRDHSIERLYCAWVQGVPGEDEGRVDRPIGRHPRDRRRMSVAARHGREAHTRWKVERRWRARGVSRLAVSPETGRTHQIRVHLASRGLPILGDDLYGRGGGRDRALRGLARGLARPALHAARLGFRHPVSGGHLCFEAEPPEDLRALEATLDAAEAGRA